MGRILYRIKNEFRLIGCRLAVISVSVLFCAMGGILLWVNGGSGWYIVNTLHKNSLPLSVIFLTWLIVYALYGFRLAVRGFCPCDKRYAAVQGAVCLAYIFDLVWYALFFCTRLSLFALIMILIAVFLNITAFVRSGRGVITARWADIAVVLCEIFYAVFTVMYGLLK